MDKWIRPVLAGLLLTGIAGTAAGQTCVAIDETKDMLGREDRIAARLLIGKQFELAGHQVVERDCTATFTVVHIRLGTTITVTLSGPGGAREATALGLDDLPAVYSQLVRSLTTGQPMGLGVVDRTNVTATQDMPPRRIATEGTWYARVGYGSIFGRSADNGATFGFGYRAEFDRVGLDISFLNAQINDDSRYYGPSSSAWSLIKLQGLFFTNPTSNRSAYLGGGLSYGRTELRNTTPEGFPSSGRGAGLQAGLTAGYEIARVTSVRMFVQADLTLPLYHVQFETFSYPEPAPGGRFVAPTVTVEREYAPSLAVSVGLGWQRRPR
jgi:hypothetical protein